MNKQNEKQKDFHTLKFNVEIPNPSKNLAEMFEEENIIDIQPIVKKALEVYEKQKKINKNSSHR